MPRKKPFRPGNEISQTYNNGIVTLYKTEDKAPAGYQPVVQAKKKYKVPFEEQVLGITRLYYGRQEQAEIKKLLRIPRVDVSTQDLAQTHDGKWYSIHSVQSVKEVYPPSLDISLVAESRTVEVVP